MSSAGRTGTRPRLMLQYLEPAPLVDGADPAWLRDHLVMALETLAPSDLALGWRLGEERIAVLRPVIPREVSLWRWVPMLTQPASDWASAGLLQVGPAGRAPAPFHAMDDFRFLCPSHETVISASATRAIRLAHEIDADGVLLDRIRWHSPSQAPSAELTCFCDRCRDLVSGEGLDLGAVEDELSVASRSSEGRTRVVRLLLGRLGDGSLRDFVEWRQRHVSAVVAELADTVRRAGLRTALDVFTPALAFSVGQDLGAIAPAGEWSKSMTYLDAVGPATMPYELRGYARWLEEGGVGDPARVLAEALGFTPPGVSGSGPRLDALSVEVGRLAEAVGRDRAVLGLDAVELPGVCEVRDEDLAARLGAVRDAGIGVSPSWELLAIGPERIRRIATSV